MPMKASTSSQELTSMIAPRFFLPPEIETQLMKNVLRSFLLLLVALVAMNGYASDTKKSDADQAAGKWLALVDGQQYLESWNRAATLFKQQVSADNWLQAISAARKPLGSMISRKLVSATYATSLPGAPDGEYVVLQYQTRFQFKANAIETVTPMLDDSRWRVSGYYVR